MNKFTLLLDAIENPDSYSENELEAILQDPENRETLAILDKTTSSLTPIASPDIENEWKRFENNHRPSVKSHMTRIRDFVSRNIAATVSLCILSFTAMATIAGIGIRHINKSKIDGDCRTEVVIAEEAPMMTSDPLPDSVIPGTGDRSTPETVIFDNETLENIINVMAAYYDCSVVFNNDTPKSFRLYFRWDRALSLEEVVTRLNNFEQLHISIEDKTIKVD